MYQWTDERFEPAVVTRLKAAYPYATRVRHRDGRAGMVRSWRQQFRWNRIAGQDMAHDQVLINWTDVGLSWVRGSRPSWVDVANLTVITDE